MCGVCEPCVKWNEVQNDQDKWCWDDRNCKVQEWSDKKKMYQVADIMLLKYVIKYYNVGIGNE